VLKALFEPICEDYRRVEAEVDAFPAERLTVLASGSFSRRRGRGRRASVTK